MQILNPAFDYQNFRRHLKTAPGRVLMLDYDGTLAPFVSDRDQALPYAGVRESLKVILANRKTRLVIISGRPVADLVRLVGLDRLPEMWGSHGLERRLPSGELRQAPLRAETEEGLKAIYGWALEHGLSAITERKPGGIAFHWRGRNTEESAGIRELVATKWQVKTSAFGLTMHEFDGGIELRASHISKADAVGEILATSERSFAAAYLGDDLTDEDAFRAIRGRGVGVLVRPELRSTAADLWLEPPGELLAFLGEWV
jgi:trehalose 6-phosphate phosphatase